MAAIGRRREGKQGDEDLAGSDYDGMHGRRRYLRRRPMVRTLPKSECKESDDDGDGSEICRSQLQCDTT